MKKLVLLILLEFICFSTFAQINRPKVVVGIVVDQMRPDYITRYYNQFGNGGFRKLLKEGYSMWNIQLNYIPTYTGPGHASIYSGTTPRYHGIIANDIYNRETKKSDYCVKDTFDVIGNSRVSKGNGMSPHRLTATNICDELKLCSNKQSKVISMSLKDRAAILSGGHMADYALWFDQESGYFVTSSFYNKQLPGWVSEFNAQNMADNYSKNPWQPLLETDAYSNSTIDTSIYAVTQSGNKLLPSFPHSLTLASNAKGAKYSLLYRSPFANSLLTDLVIKMIKSNDLGKGEYPDFLAISFSSTDAVGHTYGPLSKEVEDTYLRLDKDIERLLQTLDGTFGKDNYVLFLTADHGVADVPKFLTKEKAPAGYMNYEALLNKATAYLNTKLGEGNWIDTFINDQFYLNRKLIAEKGLELKTVQTQLAEFLQQQKGIAFVYTATTLNESEFYSILAMRVQNGFQPKNSGDVMIVTESGYFEYGSGSLAEHGSGYSYDTNVPLLWYGKNIKKGEESWLPHSISDIAPTLSMLLKIKYPSACIGNPIIEITGNK